MNVKIDTKEKFHVITVQEPVLYANMTEELIETFNKCKQNNVKNIVLNAGLVTQIDIELANSVLRYQQETYENNHSFVLCCLVPEVEEKLEQEGILEMLNVTPTESEAWDIIQMEEIERELLNGMDEEF